MSIDLILLTLASFVGSIISGITGIGGGMLLMGFMSPIISPPQLIPTHGAVQLVSNINRTILHFRYFNKRVAGLYFIGACIGAYFGTLFQISLSKATLGFCIGAYILKSLWINFNKINILNFLLDHIGILGAISTILSLFIGVTGPLVHTHLLKQKYENRFAFIGTEGFCAGTTHLFKILVYTSWGVSILPQMHLIIPMIFATILGSYVGKQLLGKLNEKYFRLIIKWLLTFLGLKLVITSILSWI